MNRRREREKYSKLKKGYYHMSTDGWQDGLLFHTTGQYAYGMIQLGLLHLKFDLRIYSFCLMPNHIHILLSGSGSSCIKAFYYFKHKMSACLLKDGCPGIPEDYWFKLVSVENERQMRNNFIYVDRNPYEQGLCVPTSYLWSSAHLHFSPLGTLLTGMRADTLSAREVERRIGSRTPVPAHWQFHPLLGLLPSSFVDNRLFLKLFKNPKDYVGNLVKDYEMYVQMAEILEEEPVFSVEEVEDISQKLSSAHFPGRGVNQLTNEEKGRLCVLLNQTYKVPASLMAQSLKIPEHIVKQFLSAKEYGKRRL